MLVAVAAIRLRDLFAVAMLFGIYSFLTAALFMVLGAADVAFTEAAVGAGVTTVLMLSALRMTSRYERAPRHRPLIPLIVVGVTGAALIYGTLDAPPLGAADAPAQGHVAPRYIERGPVEVGVPNMVTAVLASYRGYDTLGETVVIFIAGLTVPLLLGLRTGPGGGVRPAEVENQLVLRVVVKALIPFVLLFAWYVQLHGDYGAGGGFQAGVIFATGFVLYELVFGMERARRVVPPQWLGRLAAIGVLIFGLVGLAGMLRGSAFLDYSVLAADPLQGQHLGILLVELGVGMTVFAVILSIFYAFAGRAGES